MASVVIETLLVVGAVAGTAIVALLASLVPPDTLLFSGGVITGVGLAIGVPTGIAYHVALYRVLRQKGTLPRGWWLHPVPLHGGLPAERRSSVLRWFVVGGLGFAVVVLGCAVVVLGLMVPFWRPSP